MHDPAVRVGDPLTFYAVAATVIPVLYIAIMFQTRPVQGVMEDEISASRLNLASNGINYLVFIAGWGEWSALRVLANQHPTRLLAHMTSVSMFVLALALFAEPMLTMALKFDQRAQEGVRSGSLTGRTARFASWFRSWQLLLVGLLAMLLWGLFSIFS
jgi:hypothetical protein